MCALFLTSNVMMAQDCKKETKKTECCKEKKECDKEKKDSCQKKDSCKKECSKSDKK